MPSAVCSRCSLRQIQNFTLIGPEKQGTKTAVLWDTFPLQYSCCLIHTAGPKIMCLPAG